MYNEHLQKCYIVIHDHNMNRFPQCTITEINVHNRDLIFISKNKNKKKLHNLNSYYTK